MVIPEPAVLVVVRVVVGLVAVDLLHDAVEYVANDGGAGKGRVRGAGEGILELAGCFLAARVKGFFCAGEVGCYLGLESLVSFPKGCSAL